MSKTISIHGSKCGFTCPHKSVCYHINKQVKCRSNFDIDTLIKMAKDYKDAKVYMSVCSEDDFIKGIYLLKNTDNVHLTIPVHKFDEKMFNCDEFDVRNRIQVTVYDQTYADQVGENIQKLFLIKDNISYISALNNFNNEHTSNIHYPIAQEYIDKEKLIELVTAWRDCKDPTITLDSCLENFLIHEKCVYNEDYVDINFDGTFRKCPFKKNGFLIRENETIDSMIEFKDEPSCIYSELFGGKDG